MTTTARFARTSTRGVLLGFSMARVVVVALAAILLIAGLVAGGLIGFVVSAPLWGLLVSAAFVPIQGEPAVEWVGPAGLFAARQATGQTEFRAKPSQPRPAGTLALPGDAAALRFYVDPVTGAVMVHDPHRQTMTAALSVTHPAYVLLSPDDQDQRVASWGRVLASLAGSGTVAAIQILETTVPDAGLGVQSWYDEHGSQLGGWFDAEYEALLAQMHTGGIQHQTTIAIALDMKAAASAIRAAGRGMKGAAAVLSHEMVGLEQSLRTAGLHVEHWLRASELAVMVRRAYDQASTVQPGDPGANLDHAGPLAVSEHWSNFGSSDVSVGALRC